jgi:hypothetical protein
MWQISHRTTTTTALELTPLAFEHIIHYDETKQEDQNETEEAQRTLCSILR